MQRYEVLLTGDAERDLEELFDYIYLIVDGRRDMQTLLARRLLGT